MTIIATWNVNSLRVRLEHVLDWLQTYQPDILALQEIKMVDEDFPVDAFKKINYEVTFSGQKTYNGVAIISKTKPKDIITDIPTLKDPQRRVLGASYGKIRVLNLYVPNGQSVDSEKYEYKLNWLKKLRNYVKSQIKDYPKLVILGDFNIAPEDRDVHDPKAWVGNVLVSEPERKALHDIMALGLDDVFRMFNQEEGQFSWWDYRAGAFQRNRGMRIDLILTSPAMSKVCKQSLIDKEPRAWERPSDHVPVSAEFTS